MTDIIFEIKQTDIPGLHDHFINGEKVTRMTYVVEARRVFLEAALGQTVRVSVESTLEDGEAKQTEERHQPSPPRLARVSSVPSGGWVERLPRTYEEFKRWTPRDLRPDFPPTGTVMEDSSG